MRRSWKPWFVEMAKEAAKARKPYLYGYYRGEPIYDRAQWVAYLATERGFNAG